MIPAEHTAFSTSEEDAISRRVNVEVDRTAEQSIISKRIRGIFMKLNDCGRDYQRRIQRVSRPSTECPIFQVSICTVISL